MVKLVVLDQETLVQGNYRINKAITWKRDRNNEWTDEGVLRGIANGKIYRGKVYGDCDDYVTCKFIWLHEVMGVPITQLKYKEMLVEVDGVTENHAVLCYFINPMEWYVLDNRFTVPIKKRYKDVQTRLEENI